MWFQQQSVASVSQAWSRRTWWRPCHDKVSLCCQAGVGLEDANTLVALFSAKRWCTVNRVKTATGVTEVRNGRLRNSDLHWWRPGSAMMGLDDDGNCAQKEWSNEELGAGGTRYQARWRPHPRTLWRASTTHITRPSRAHKGTTD